MRHLNNGTDHRHSKSCCDQSSPARRTMNVIPGIWLLLFAESMTDHLPSSYVVPGHQLSKYVAPGDLLSWYVVPGHQLLQYVHQVICCHSMWHQVISCYNMCTRSSAVTVCGTRSSAVTVCGTRSSAVTYMVQYWNRVYSINLFCCALFCCVYFDNSLWIHVIYLPIFFRVASLALGQSYDCPSASEGTLKDMGKTIWTKPQQHTTAHNKMLTIYIILTYCISQENKVTRVVWTICSQPLGSDDIFHCGPWKSVVIFMKATVFYDVLLSKSKAIAFYDVLLSKPGLQDVT